MHTVVNIIKYFNSDIVIIGHQDADDYICGCVVNSSWGWE